MPRKPRKLLIGAAQGKCPYCGGKEIVKKGQREKKLEIVQLWYCTHCKKVFTPQLVKGHTFPLTVIFDGLSYYNLGYTLEDSCRFLKAKYGLVIPPPTLGGWLEEFKDYCRYSRMRPYAIRRYSPEKTMISATLYHRQVYTFRYHPAKLELLL